VVVKENILKNATEENEEKQGAINPIYKG